MRDKDRMLTTVQAARILSINPKTLGKWRCAGKGPPVLQFGRLVRYPESFLMQWCSTYTKHRRGQLITPSRMEPYDGAIRAIAKVKAL